MDDSVAPLVTALADRYRIEEELGAGGMATVYLAVDLKHHRKVAVKVLRRDLLAPHASERFDREIRIAASLVHPHILPLHDSGVAGGRLYYVMPYVQGPTLREQMLQTGPLPVAEAVRILRDVAAAFAYAHRLGVIHRDLKPDNVMLAEGHAVVADFGVAKAVREATSSQDLTTVGVTLGTPMYVSPEQATADPSLDHRSDIYSFGVLAYELLCGEPPFTGASSREVLMAHVTVQPMPIGDRRPALPAPLATLVMKCLEKNPADRWQNADNLVGELERFLTPSEGTEPVTVAVAEPPDIAAVGLPARRRPRLLQVVTKHPRRYVAAATIVGATALWAFAVRPSWLSPGGIDTGQAAGSSAAVADSIELVVLPFNSFSADRTTEGELGPGIQAMLISELSHYDHIRIVEGSGIAGAAGSSAAVPGDQALELAQDAGVDYVITGGVVSTSSGIRIDARIIQVATRGIMGTEQVSGPADNIDPIVRGAASRIADLLNLSRSSAADARTIPSEAITLYSRAKYAEEGGRRDRAIELYREITERFPDLTEAKERLAELTGR